jgi:hypothetical protein
MLELIHRFLNDGNRHTLLSKQRYSRTLSALWSIGFYNTEEIQTLVPEYQESAKYQVADLTLLFMRCTQYPA